MLPNEHTAPAALPRGPPGLEGCLSLSFLANKQGRIASKVHAAESLAKRGAQTVQRFPLRESHDRPPFRESCQPIGNLLEIQVPLDHEPVNKAVGEHHLTGESFVRGD